jgi:ADP-ribose pyrophosphatase
VSRRPVFRGRIVNLGVETVTLPNGHTVELEILRHPGAAAVVPLHDDGSVTLVYQYRHAGGGWHYELPAGVLEPGEAPVTAAARELSEEAQLAGELRLLTTIYTTPGFTDERIHIFVATDLRPTDGHPEADEALHAVRLPLAEALAMARDGRITDGKTLVGLLLAGT